MTILFITKNEVIIIIIISLNYTIDGAVTKFYYYTYYKNLHK